MARHPVLAVIFLEKDELAWDLGNPDGRSVGTFATDFCKFRSARK